MIKRYMERELRSGKAIPWYLGYAWTEHAIRCQIYALIGLNIILAKVRMWHFRLQNGVINNAIEDAYWHGYHARSEEISKIYGQGRKAGMEELGGKFVELLKK